MDSTTPSDIQPTPQAERFYAGAIRRILRTLLVLTIVVPFAVWWFYGLLVAAGFFLGAGLAWLNFRSLASSAKALAGRIVEAQSRERGASVVFRFLLRYVLVGIAAYAIFRGSSQAFRGFLFGLCLPVAAMLCEAGYEAYAALHRGY